MEKVARQALSLALLVAVVAFCVDHWDAVYGSFQRLGREAAARGLLGGVGMFCVDRSYRGMCLCRHRVTAHPNYPAPFAEYVDVCTPFRLLNSKKYRNMRFACLSNSAKAWPTRRIAEHHIILRLLKPSTYRNRVIICVEAVSHDLSSRLLLSQHMVVPVNVHLHCQ